MEGNERFEALFQFATEGILIVNEKGEIISINPSAEKLFGYDKGELIQKKIETLVPQRISKIHKQHREKYNINPHARTMGTGFDLYGKRKNGSEFPVEISLSPYSSAKEKFVVAFIIDITIRKQEEERLKNYSVELEKQVEDRTLILHEAVAELEKTKAELNEVLKKERELNDIKSRFVSMASHEFRTPLTTILSSVSLASKYAEQNDAENHNKHINRIKSAITNLTDILNDFLSLSKLEEGKITTHQEHFDIESFMNDIVNEMKVLAKKGQTISYFHSGKNASVLLDSKILKNILFNLISNAIKFSPEKELIEIHSEISNSQLIISVKDNGIGISKQDRKHLFERFFRGSNATAIQGTGLGLNIVARYMELMNGTIDFVSKENEGTTFTLKYNL